MRLGSAQESVQSYASNRRALRTAKLRLWGALSKQSGVTGMSLQTFRKGEDRGQHRTELQRKAKLWHDVLMLFAER